MTEEITVLGDRGCYEEEVTEKGGARDAPGIRGRRTYSSWRKRDWLEVQ